MDWSNGRVSQVTLLKLKTDSVLVTSRCLSKPFRTGLAATVESCVTASRSREVSSLLLEDMMGISMLGNKDRCWRR